MNSAGLYQHSETHWLRTLEGFLPSSFLHFLETGPFIVLRVVKDTMEKKITLVFKEALTFLGESTPFVQIKQVQKWGLMTIL